MAREARGDALPQPRRALLPRHARHGGQGAAVLPPDRRRGLALDLEPRLDEVQRVGDQLRAEGGHHGQRVLLQHRAGRGDASTWSIFVRVHFRFSSQEIR